MVSNISNTNNSIYYLSLVYTYSNDIAMVSIQLNGLDSNYLTLKILYQSFVCWQWIGLKYCYLILIILFNIIHSFAHSQMVPSIAM